jgi:hypothetical protein
LKELIRDEQYKDYVIKINEINRFKNEFRATHYTLHPDLKRKIADDIYNMEKEMRHIENVLFYESNTE